MQSPSPHNESLQNQCLDLLRFPLAVVILYIHIFINIPSLTVTAGAHFLQGVEAVVMAFLSAQSVPIYFFISGYVFFLKGKYDLRAYVQKLKNRVHTLFIPYIVWNTVALLTILLFMLPPFAAFNPVEQQPQFSLSSLINTFWNSEYGVFPAHEPTGYIFPQNNALWFLRDLMVLALLSPIIYTLLKGGKPYAIYIAAVMWLLTDYFTFNAIYFPFQGLFFFSLGAYLSINKRDIITLFRQWRIAAVFFYLLFSVLYMQLRHIHPDVASLIKAANMLAGLVVAYNIAAALLQSGICKVNTRLASSAIFIYLAQTICVKYIFKALVAVLHTTNGYVIFMLSLVALVLSLFFLLALFMLMKRYTPRLLSFVTGRKQ